MKKERIDTFTNPGGEVVAAWRTDFATVTPAWVMATAVMNRNIPQPLFHNAPEARWLVGPPFGEPTVMSDGLFTRTHHEAGYVEAHIANDTAFDDIFYSVRCIVEFTNYGLRVQTPQQRSRELKQYVALLLGALALAAAAIVFAATFGMKPPPTTVPPERASMIA